MEMLEKLEKCSQKGLHGQRGQPPPLQRMAAAPQGPPQHRATRHLDLARPPGRCAVCSGASRGRRRGAASDAAMPLSDCARRCAECSGAPCGAAAPHEHSHSRAKVSTPPADRSSQPFRNPKDNAAPPAQAYMRASMLDPAPRLALHQPRRRP